MIIIKKELIVKQKDNKECGAASLLSIIRYYGGNISMAKLNDITNTTKEGTNFYEIKKASITLGMNAKAFNITDGYSLSNTICPFIAQIRNKNSMHFVVVYHISKSNIVLMDPALGKVTMNKRTFFDNWTGNILVFDVNKELEYIKDSKYINSLILNIILKNKKLIINIIILSILFTTFTCLYSFFLKIMIDDVIGTTKNNAKSILFIFIVIALIKTFINYIRNQLLIYLNEKIDISLILNTFKKLLSLPYNYYKNKTTGEVISRINDLANVKNMIAKITLTVFLDFLLVIVGGIILFNINTKLFGITFIIGFIYVIILLIFRPFLSRMTRINLENNAYVNSFLVENISGIETIKGLNISSLIEEKMEYLYVKALNHLFKYNSICNLELLVKDIVGLIGFLLIIYVGIGMVMDGTLSLGSLLTFNTLVIYFLDPIRNIIDLNMDYQSAIHSLKRANDLYEIDSEKDIKSNLLLNGNIKFSNVYFSHNSKKQILTKVNFDIKNKDRVMIIGSSGSGKSTILKLLYKYYPVDRNKIVINNIDINDYGIDNIRNNICYISQNEIVYTDSIYNNIALDRDINYEEFINVCKLTHVDKIVKNNVLGYDMLLEENGSNISGGERSRIILARALLKKNKILMIDEGFGEMDVNLERLILKNIIKYYKNITIIVVSHRYENMDLFNKIIKLEDGQAEIILKEGNNDEY